MTIKKIKFKGKKIRPRIKRKMERKASVGPVTFNKVAAYTELKKQIFKVNSLSKGVEDSATKKRAAPPPRTRIILNFSIKILLTINY